MAMEQHVLSDVAICILAAWLLGVAAQMGRQPLLLAYLVAGFLIGPVGFKLVSARESIELISNIGLILLLFLIGLEIDLKKIASAGRPIILTSVTQIFGSWALGTLVFWLAGFSFRDGKLDALYLGVAAALSSTVIIVKSLHEHRELDTLQGRITLGVLVLQDLVAILFLAIQPNLTDPRASIFLASAGKVVVLLSIAFLGSRYLLPPLFRSVARQPELVLIGAIAWCFLIAGVAEAFHLSREMGALMAGVAISTFPYTLDIAAKLTSLRDFFVTLFFVALGMKVPPPSLSLVGWGLLISFVVFATRFVTVFPCLHGLRQGLRSSLLPAVNLSQISELSLVILALGAAYGHVSTEAQGMVAYAFVFLGVASTYAMSFGDAIVAHATRWLGGLGLRDFGEASAAPGDQVTQPKIFLLGFFWSASSLLEEITRYAPHLLPEIIVIDYNPNVNQELRGRGVPVIYGDVTQRDTLLHAGISAADLIICTLPNSILRGASNLKLLKQIRSLNSDAKVVVHSDLLDDIPQLYEAGADYVLVPRILEARELRKVIEAARTNLIHQKRAELDHELSDRREVIP